MLMKTCMTSLAAVVALSLGAAAFAQINIPSDGSDGAFNPGANVEIDLSLAPTAHWSTPGNGNGVYDPDQWAVIFKFSEVNIPSNVTVTFKNHPSGAPVMWLVQGDVVIDGIVSLNGVAGLQTAFSGGNPVFVDAGPGGFRGGRANSVNLADATGGFGPGGGNAGTSGRVSGGGGGYAETGGPGASGGAAGGIPYGNIGVFPLIGGAGGGGARSDSSQVGGGGGGGGAILIATSGDILLSGTVRANGGTGGNSSSGGAARGGGGGSGGGMRLIAQSISGNGLLLALGGAGGPAWVPGGTGSNGRIRLEAYEVNLTNPSSPVYSGGMPAKNPRIFRDAETPTVRAVVLGGEDVPHDTRPQFALPSDVHLEEGGPTVLLIEAENMPPSGTMVVRMVRTNGVTETVPATFVSGNAAFSTWEAVLELTQGFSGIQIRAVMPEKR
jgi:hypothetical protein